MIGSTELVTVSGTQTVVLRRLEGRYSARIRNVGSQPVYLGPTGVSVSSGWRLDPGDELPVSVDSDIYAIVNPALRLPAISTPHQLVTLSEWSP